MKKYFLFIFFCFLTVTYAKDEIATHREHKAHVHGSGGLSIAFDGLQGQIELRIPADSILGFEYQPKSEQDKLELKQMTSIFENEISKLIQFDSSLSCKISKIKIGQFFEEQDPQVQLQKKHKTHSGQHSDWIANYSVQCLKSMRNTKIIVDFKQFKKINDLDIIVLIDSIQKSAEFNGIDPVIIDLK